MADPEHLAKLKEGVEAWNQWRKKQSFDGAFRYGYQYGIGISRVDLRGADLTGADLTGVDLHQAKLTGVNLIRAKLIGASLWRANLTDAHLSGAVLREAKLSGTDLSRARLNEADLSRADLSNAKLIKADLSRADLYRTDLSDADLRGADLNGADLARASLINTNFEEANLTGCRVYGISVWDVRLEGAIQSNLAITPYDRSGIQVDNLEVAQFVYLLLNNKRIRHVIDTITSKVVLILGRFTPERKATLDAIRDELRRRNYSPILFDFEKPDSKDLTGTVTTLANMARFIIADLTDPSSVPHELATIIPGTMVPVQTIILDGQREYAMFADLKRRYHWVLKPYKYATQQTLLKHLGSRVIVPAEAKAKELMRR